MENQSKSPRQMSLMQLIKAAVKISDKKFGVGKASVCVSHEIWRHGRENSDTSFSESYSIAAFLNQVGEIYFNEKKADKRELLEMFKKSTEDYVLAVDNKDLDLEF